MSQQLDVYRDWLGIKEADRPLNHYQLLKLKPFEDNNGLVRKHYRQLNAHVRKYASGEYLNESQALLNELAKAMLCLTDAQRKSEYDATLGREKKGVGKRRSFEEILLANKIIDQDQLQRSRKFADAVGLDIHMAVLQQKLAEPNIIMLAFAESIGLPYIELSDIGVDEQLLGHIPPAVGRQHSFVPVMIDDNQLLVASPTPLLPDVEDDLRLRTNMPVRTVICTPAGINDAAKKYYPRDGSFLPPTPIAAPGAAAPSQPQADKKPAKLHLDEEDKKKRIQYTLIGGNFGVMATVGALVALGMPMTLMLIFYGLIGGAIAAGITFPLVTSSLKNG